MSVSAPEGDKGAVQRLDDNSNRGDKGAVEGHYTSAAAVVRKHLVIGGGIIGSGV